MLKQLLPAIWITYAAVLEIGVLSAWDASRTPPPCVQQTKGEQERTQPPSNLVCEAADARTARYTLYLFLVTGILAASTLGLTFATFVAAKAAKEAADALPILERAYVFVESTLRTRDLDDVLNGEISELPVGQPVPPDWGIVVSNAGKTPAVVTEIRAGGRCGSDATAPGYEQEIVGADVVLRAGGPSEFWPVSFDPELTQAQIDAIQRGEQSFRYYVIVHYLDVFGDTHVSPYYWTYNGRMDGVRPCFTAGREYNRRT
jgi:hypothetical protein